MAKRGRTKRHYTVGASFVALHEAVEAGVPPPDEIWEMGFSSPGVDYKPRGEKPCKNKNIIIDLVRALVSEYGPGRDEYKFTQKHDFNPILRKHRGDGGNDYDLKADLDSRRVFPEEALKILGWTDALWSSTGKGQYQLERLHRKNQIELPTPSQMPPGSWKVIEDTTPEDVCIDSKWDEQSVLTRMVYSRVLDQVLELDGVLEVTRAFKSSSVSGVSYEIDGVFAARMDGRRGIIPLSMKRAPDKLSYAQARNNSICAAEQFPSFKLVRSLGIVVVRNERRGYSDLFIHEFTSETDIHKIQIVSVRCIRLMDRPQRPV